MKRCAFFGAILCLLAGCASVTVLPVTHPEQEGLRFYMARPYVVVNEPFVVDGEAYLATGEITPDGKYVALTSLPPAIRDNAALSRHFAIDHATGAALTTYLPAPITGGQEGLLPLPMAGGLPAILESVKTWKQYSDLMRSLLRKEGADDTEDTPDTDSSDGVEKPEEGKKTTESTGVLNLKMANDNTDFALIPLKRYFDIVLLPDFDREMAVTGRHGLGNASISMEMAQGWMLNGLEATADNSAIQKRIFQAIDLGMSLLSSQATAYLGLAAPAPGGQQGGLMDEAGPQAKLFSGGTPVAVKITRVRIVAPGLYKILKPAELKNRNPKTDAENYGHRLHVPIYPYTDIAWNVVDAIVVEAAMVSGDTALRIHQYVNAGTPPAFGTAPVDNSILDLSTPHITPDNGNIHP